MESRIPKIYVDDAQIMNISDDNLGQKYSCKICGFAPSRIDCRIKGWGKAQYLRKVVRDHVKHQHSKVNEHGEKSRVEAEEEEEFDITRDDSWVHEQNVW